MTREEAIYELKNAAWLGTDHSRARTEEAVEMAISALTLKSPCSLCRFRNEDTGICDMCPAMPLERGAE